MAGTFEFVGTLKAIKDSDKFKGYEDKSYDSGWISRKLRFNMICGTNRHMLSVDGGKFADEHNKIYSFTKGTVDDDGNKVKGKSVQIDFKDRFDENILSTIAEWKKFVIDTEEPKRRYLLQNAMENIKEGKEISADDLADMGVSSEAEISTELEKSKKKRHEFISEWDYAECIKKVIDSGKYNDRAFLVKGEIVKQLSADKTKWYTSYVPTRMYLADKDADAKSEATMTVYYDSDGLDELSVEETGKYYLNAFTMEYNKDDKKNNLPADVQLVLPKAPEDDVKKVKIENKFLGWFKPEDGAVSEIGLNVEVVDGAEVKDLSPEDLSDEQQENLELGLVTMEDIKRELGISNTFGDRVTEYKITGLASGYSSGCKETAFEPEMLVLSNVIVAEDTSGIDAVIDGMDDEEI